MTKVAIIRCNNYEEAHVLTAVKRGIDELGGIEQFISAGEKVCMKPNMLAADAPERCSTTHPAVFKAVGKVLIDAGANVTYGDSPAFHSPLTAAKKNGIAAVAEQLEIPLADFENGRWILYEQGSQNKKFLIANGILEADKIVSLPKLKTHGFAKMTGSIKNQFGCIPGKLKGEMHVKLPGAIDFSRMLVDLNHYVNPCLYVMDGIMAMEGNGPRGGSPKAMNVLIMSSDPVALDATVCKMINLKPELVPTTKIGQEVGMGTYDTAQIEYVGDPISDFMVDIFDVVREPIKPYKKSGLMRQVTNLTVPRPYIIEDKCVKCGVCALMCPVTPKAVNWDNGDKSKPPVYNYKHCIRCYCCQELCPESAIKLHVPILRRIVDGKTYKH